MKKFKHVYKKGGTTIEVEVSQSYIEKYYELDELNSDGTETLEFFLTSCEKNDFWSNSVDTFITI